MMDVLVALIRNGSCCMKDLRLFPSSLLHDPSYISQYITFPDPHLEKTTPLEVLIALSQLYACITLIRKGFKVLYFKCVFKLQRLNRVTDIHLATYQKQELSSKSKDTATAHELVTQSLYHESCAASRSFFEGISLVFTGIGFFWFFAHSLHITDTGWIGGLLGLIHALTVMQIALVFFLYYMFKDGAKGTHCSRRILQTIEEISITEINKSKDIRKDKIWLTFETYNFLLDKNWDPFWTTGDTSTADKLAEEKMLAKEIELAEMRVKSFNKADMIMDSETIARLEEKALIEKWGGYEQYISFILNIFAFYGYSMAVLVFYFDDGEKQPGYIKAMKVGYSNDDADWTGNFIGDLMWTIEPIFILGSPLIMKLLLSQNKRKKVKSD